MRKRDNTGGGYNNYSIRSATDVTNYFPGPMRSNVLLDPNSAIGSVDRIKPISEEQIYSGPGSINQALPDASRFQTSRILPNTFANPYRTFEEDNRQIANYQIEQLQNNPLSQYTNNPDGYIPNFDCDKNPDSFSTLTNQRERDYKNYFEGKMGANDNIVYNLSVDSTEEVNPFIALGSSSTGRTQADFTGKCYSNDFEPGYTIGTNSGPYPPVVYGDNNECTTNKSLSFINPLII